MQSESESEQLPIQIQIQTAPDCTTVQNYSSNFWGVEKISPFFPKWRGVTAKYKKSPPILPNLVFVWSIYRGSTSFLKIWRIQNFFPIWGSVSFDENGVCRQFSAVSLQFGIPPSLCFCSFPKARRYIHHLYFSLKFSWKHLFLFNWLID